MKKTNVNLIGRDTNKFGHLYEVFKIPNQTMSLPARRVQKQVRRVLNKSKDLCVERSRDTNFTFG